MNKILITLLSITTTFSVLAAEGFSSVEEQMTGKEFSAAGLDKLSQTELDSLNEWIRRHSLATLASTNSGTKAAETGEANRGLKTKDDDVERSTINATLVGKFTGWDGQTTFKLDNGMIWAQADKDKFHTKEVKNPTVTIEPGMFGSWRLSVADYDEDCKVKRIQ
jgi:hypothetical protein